MISFLATPILRTNPEENMNCQMSDREQNVSASPYSAKRTRHHVDFFCHAPNAKQVCLAGDFNEWQPTANPMQRMPDGCWMASLELTHGHHEYLFLVDDRPVLDPRANGIVRNSRNERVSLLAVS
jgi:1,4-alpha-glucan branching enzyme